MKITTAHIEKAMILQMDKAPIRSLRTCALHPFHEIDFLTVTSSNYAIEYEIKVSRSDFFADFKKKKHRQMARGKGGKISKFYYVCPLDMIKEKEVPSYAGLIYVDKYGQLITVKKAPRLVSDKLTHDEITKIYRSIMFRWLAKEANKNNKVVANR